MDKVAAVLEAAGPRWVQSILHCRKSIRVELCTETQVVTRRGRWQMHPLIRFIPGREGVLREQTLRAVLEPRVGRGESFWNLICLGRTERGWV